MREMTLIYTVLMLLLQVCIVLHSSIISYVEQRYHNFTQYESALGKSLAKAYNDIMLAESTLFHKAHKISNAFENARIAIFEPESKKSIKPKKDNNTKKATHQNITQNTPKIPKKDNFLKQEYSQQSQETIAESIDSIAKLNNDSAIIESIESTPTQSQPALNESNESMLPNPQIIRIHQNAHILLIGDSMMQGVALHLAKPFRALNISPINLSKHSTGLTHKHYFDWEEAMRNVFENTPNIEIVAVLLGANDPWNMKNGIKFKTPQWEAIYLQRIGEIIAVAQSYGARVVWYEVPFVKDSDLNENIIYLNSLYERALKAYGEYFLHTNGIITQDNRYSTFIKDELGKNIPVRGDDGVHFTTQGYQIMGEILLKYIQVENNQKAEQ